MVHCSECSSQTACTSCFNPYDVGTGQRCTACKSPLFYVSKLCIDDPNCVSAYKTSGNVVMCAFCDMAKHFILDDKRKCVCRKGFHARTSGCEEICGDGLIFVSECDDNNTKDNDGCSSSCKLEKDFLCTNEQLGMTKCKLNKNVVLKLDYVDKITDQNKALIYISLDSDNPNVHAYYRSILFDYNVTSNRS
jgi:cysteine-rich repeat protein